MAPLMLAGLCFGPASAESETPGALPLPVSALQDAVIQNTPGFSEGYAAGVPRSYAWCGGSYKPAVNAKPPAGFTAVTGWGQVYRKVGATAEPGSPGKIIVANFRTLVRLSASQKWIVVQDQAWGALAGGHFVANFAGNEAIEMEFKLRRDRSVVLGVPPDGYNSHFWPVERGTYLPGSVDGVYVQMDVRVTSPDIGLVANIGADWWRDGTAGFTPGFANNPGAGMSNWIELSTEWSVLRFYSGGTPELLAAPPPPLIEFTTGTMPTIVRRVTAASSPCRPVSADAAP
jgi:hypothetical protein